MDGKTRSALLIFSASFCAGVASAVLTTLIREKMEDRRSLRDTEMALERLESYRTECWDIPEGVNVVVENAMDPKPVDYTAYSRHGEEEEKEPFSAEDGIEIISEEEFVKGTGNLLDGYVSVTGTYFADEKVLAGWDDALDEKDAATTIGEKAISLLEGGEDAVYVRNGHLKVLYEVLKSNESYETAAQEALAAEADDPAFTDES